MFFKKRGELEAWSDACIAVEKYGKVCNAIYFIDTSVILTREDIDVFADIKFVS